MQTYLLLLLAIVPGIALTIYFRQKDRYQLEPWPVVRNAFLVGMLLVIPAVVLEVAFLPNPAPLGFWPLVFYMVLGVGLIEELCKWFGLRVYAARHKDFDEVMDGLVYGAATAAGFATVENISYVFQYGFLTGIIRAVYSVPMHTMTGALIGYWLARRRFEGANAGTAVLFGLVFAMLMHGIFNVGASFGSGGGLLIMTAVMAMLIIAVLAAGRRSLRGSRAMFGMPDVVLPDGEAAAEPETAVVHPPEPAVVAPAWPRQLLLTLLVLATAVSVLFSLFLWLGLWLLIQDGEEINAATWIVAVFPVLGSLSFMLILLRAGRKPKAAN